jgi:phosphatidylserine/phosphatidylglycerophosphate/cardiolipin synthase-like enzyme
LTSQLLGADELRVGGGELLLEFFEEAFRMRVERLVVLAPYVDDGAFADSALRNSWERALAITENTIVVRTAPSAEAVLRATQSGQRRRDLRVHPKLHAKVFVAWRTGAEIALVGSHNLTGAALHTNKEIGMLLKPTTNGTRRIVWQLRAAIDAVVRNSSPYCTKAGPSLTGSRSRSNGAAQCSRNPFDRASRRGSVI